MKLNLCITSYKGDIPSDPLSLSLDQQSATIGRLKDNTLVLPDAMRYLSGHHAKIEYQAPDYYLVDTSTNGVFINHSSNPLGNGNRVKLQNNDLITIGDYDMVVEISEQDETAASAHLNQPLSSTPFSQENGAMESGAIDFPDNPFAALDSDPVEQMIEANKLIPDNWKTDQENNSDPFAIPVTTSAEIVPEQRKEFDHIPAFQEAFQPFKKQQESAADLHKLDTEENTPSAPADIFAENWFIKDKNSGQSQDDENSATIEDPQLKSVQHLIDEAQGDKVSTQPDLIQPEVEVPPAPPAQSISEPSHAQVNTGDLEDLVQNFLRGADLKDERLAKAITAETFHTIGTILRSSIQGAMEVLDSRAKIKSEMHLDVTMIRPVENNPIKFSVSADEALTKLLLHQDKGYLPAEEAIDEAFNDIRAHQFSVMAGMKTALIEILQRFDPEKLELRLQKQSPLIASIPIRKQAKLWDLFEQLYEEIKHEAEDDFYHLFGQAFAESYEQQIKKLKAAQDDISIE